MCFLHRTGSSQKPLPVLCPYLPQSGLHQVWYHWELNKCMLTDCLPSTRAGGDSHTTFFLSPNLQPSLGQSFSPWSLPGHIMHIQLWPLHVISLLQRWLDPKLASHPDQIAGPPDPSCSCSQSFRGESWNPRHQTEEAGSWARTGAQTGHCLAV